MIVLKCSRGPNKIKWWVRFGPGALRLARVFGGKLSSIIQVLPDLLTQTETNLPQTPIEGSDVTYKVF